jgi:hypothetical protein
VQWFYGVEISGTVNRRAVFSCAVISCAVVYGKVVSGAVIRRGVVCCAAVSVAVISGACSGQCVEG